MLRRTKSVWTVLGLLALVLLYLRVGPEPVPTGLPAARDVERLYEAQQSGVVVEDRGVIARLLPDDREGSRHQRFILRLDSGHTLLISHNIDLAPRVAELEPGDEVGFRGQYEWNERGGVVHWTHHDPQGERPGGWLLHEGRTYR